MHNFKVVSKVGIIIWTMTIVAYLISILINNYYSRTTISPYYKEIYGKFIKQNEVLIKIVRMIIITLSLAILIGVHYYDLKTTMKLISLLVGGILPAYFLLLIGANLEEKSVARPVGESEDKKDIKTFLSG